MNKMIKKTEKLIGIMLARNAYSKHGRRQVREGRLGLPVFYAGNFLFVVDSIVMENN